MAYNNFFPATYQPQYFNPYQAQQMPQMQQVPQAQQMQQPQNQQIQNGGFVSVRSEEEARNYPVAPGNSVTFRNETAPYVYTKTMGFSQLDRPTFDKYRLVKEDETPAEPPKKEASTPVADMVTKAEFEAVLGRVSALEADVEKLTAKKPKKKEEQTDE